MTKRKWIVAGLAVGVIVIAVGLAITRPWLAFTDVTVNDTLPIVQTADPSATGSAEPSSDPSPSAEPPSAIQLAQGSFISHEHDTTGTVTIVENPDGSRVLAIENLNTTNGPDVHVWLSAADTVEGPDGWFTAGGAEFVDLGSIKGNVGNQVYEIPPGVDLSKYPSVSLWCVQFGVSFGGAQLS